MDDLSNWYIRRSRRRFWDGDEAALRTLWHALVQALRIVSPIMPFLTEHLWQALVATRREHRTRSSSPAGPSAVEADRELLAEVAEVRQVVELGRRARSTAGIATRQPLGRLAVYGAPLAAGHRDEIAEELRVEDVRFEAGEAAGFARKPNLRCSGPASASGCRDPDRARGGRYETEVDDGLVAGEHDFGR